MRGRLGKLNLARAIGMMGENIAYIELERRGYRINPERRKCRSVCGEVREDSWEEYEKQQKLRKEISNRKPWCECLFGMGECPYGERWSRLIQEGRYIRSKTRLGTFWDFYAQKDGEEFLIEVKTTTRYYRPYFPSSALTRPQRRVLELARELGYKTLMVRIQLETSARGSLINLSRLSWSSPIFEFSFHSQY